MARTPCSYLRDPRHCALHRVDDVIHINLITASPTVPGSDGVEIGRESRAGRDFTSLLPGITVGLLGHKKAK